MKLQEWYKKPPFKEGTKVAVFEADGKMEFVRIYKETPKADNMVGRFMALADDVKGLTPQQLKDKFDLPELPTHIAKVSPPEGTNIAVGIVEKGNFGGQGKGTQFYSFDKPKDSWFQNSEVIQ